MSVILRSTNEELLKAEMWSKIKEDLGCIRSGESAAKRVVIIVPAQATLQTEQDAFAMLSEDGFMDLDVMSGEKLRFEILKETGRPDKTVIDSVGRKLLLRKIIKQNSNSLSIFNTIKDTDGFVDNAADIIVQLSQNDIDSLALENILSSMDCSSMLYTKLKDICILYREYELFMADKYTDSENLLRLVTARVKDSSYVKDSVIWYYDFYSFTKREYEFLGELSKCSQGLNAAILSGDDRYIAGRDTSVKLAEKTGASIQDIYADEKKKSLRAVVCASEYTQALTIASDILAKVREKNQSFGDIAVLTQNISKTGDSLRRYFESVGIPSFMDEKRNIGSNECVIVISSLLDIVVNGFKKQNVLLLLKSGILVKDEELIEKFENYIIQYKIYDKAFLIPFKYGGLTIERALFDKLESVRLQIAELIVPFVSDFSAAITACDKTRVLYEFLADRINLPSYLQEKESFFEELNYLDNAQLYRQSWKYVIDLFDQTVELLGDEEISSEAYANILNTSFTDIEIGVLPQAFGKVRIGSVTRSNFSNVKTLYIADFNEDVLPSNPSIDGILNDTEVKTLGANGISLIKGSDTYELEELFQIERALDTDCEELILLCTKSDAEGNEKLPSHMFNDIAEANMIEIESDIENAADYSRYIQNKELMMFKLPNALKSIYIGEETEETWKAGFNAVKESTAAISAAEGVLFRPMEKPLEKGITEPLFEKANKDFLSPTQLERYAQCPFKHYIYHGLSPSERKVFEVGSSEVGTIYHNILMRFSKQLAAICKERNIQATDISSPWMTISDREIEKAVKDILEDMKSTLLDGVISSSPEGEYKAERIAKVGVLFVKNLVEQVRKGIIKEMYFEAPFGEDKIFPPVTVNVGSSVVRIEGQIDRVDILSSASKDYVKIIDYKSGNKEFKREKIEAGLDLQLMVYLEGALGKSEDLEPAGVYYYRIKNINITKDVSFIDTVSDEVSSKIADTIASEYKLDGVTINDDVILAAIDKDITSSKEISKSTVIKKNVLPKEDMEKLRSAFKEKLTDLCTRLSQGEIDIKPAFFKGKNAGCTYCDYASICLYDIR